MKSKKIKGRQRKQEHQKSKEAKSENVKNPKISKNAREQRTCKHSLESKKRFSKSRRKKV
jgi:hypothetical protein